jgi:hypothetical protein
VRCRFVLALGSSSISLVAEICSRAFYITASALTTFFMFLALKGLSVID